MADHSHSNQEGSRDSTDRTARKPSTFVRETSRSGGIARVAYSYQRVSTILQGEKGVGLRRQHELFAPFCSEHGLIPNTNPIIDDGLSAFHERHINEGALRGFIEARKKNWIQAGSVLVVEEWDRFSRSNVSNSQRMLIEMWDLDLALAIVSQRMIITEELYNSNPGIPHILTSLQNEAHNSSLIKSRRIVDVWEQRRNDYQQNGKKFLSLSDAPSWLKIDGDDFSPNEFADTIILIFKLAVRGLSSVEIAAELNSSNLATSTGCAWSGQNVCKVIRNDQVLGHKEWKDGSTSESYFPPIVDLETVKTARELVEGRRSNPAKGRTTRKNGELGPCNNLFKGITYCQCGALMTDTHSHSGKYLDLVCSAQKKKRTCTVKTTQLWKVDEELLLMAFMERRWEKFFMTPSLSPQIQTLENQLLENERTEAKLRDKATNAAKGIEELLSGGTSDKENIQFLLELRNKAQKAADAAKRETDRTRVELDSLKRLPSGEDMREQIQKKTLEFMRLENRKDPEARNSFNKWLQTTGAKIIFVGTKPLRLQFTCADLYPDDVPAQKLLNYVEDVYPYRQDQKIIVDQSIQDFEVLGATTEQVEEQRQRLEAMIPEPKRFISPVYKGV